MAEVLDQEKREEQTSPAEQRSAFSESAPVLKKRKKNKKKIIRRIVSLVIVAALAGGGFFLWKRIGGSGEDEQTQVLVEWVSRGSITSMIEGSGAAVAKNSASVTLVTGGQVLEVYVAEGDYVQEGDPLYTLRNDDAQSRVNDAQSRVNDALKTVADYEKELSKLRNTTTDPNVRAPYRGKLIKTQEIKVGDTVVKGQEIATIVDDTRLLLPLYFSYAYENDFTVGQSARISIPVTMAQLTGRVHAIHKVERISDEGAKLFEVVFVLDNPGTLKADMLATATVQSGGETVYPYEPGALEYFRTDQLTAEVGGEVSWVNLYQYGVVNEGESVVRVTEESNEDEITSLEDQIKAAQKTVEEAQKALEEAQKSLDSLKGVSPIDGTVLSVGIKAGEEVQPGTVAVNIADTTTMIVNATVDEMYVSYVKTGMPIEVSLWGETFLPGVIESVSLSATSENGIARFPMVISVDNSEGALMSGAYVSYSFTASQSDDCLTVPIQCVKSAQTMEGEPCKVLFVQADEPPANMAELATEAYVGEGFYPVIVEIGISDNHNVEILSGVEEGTVVYGGVMRGGGMGMFF